MNMTETAAAHVITADAVAMGDPEVIVMTRDEGMGADEIERFDIDDSLACAIARDGSRRINGWRVVGDPTEVETGYWIVDVERDS